MILPENCEIKERTYNGQRDCDGKPHGYGEMIWRGKNTLGFRYIGQFSHGKRHGFGKMYSLGLIENPLDESGWYQVGEYDSAGRLIHPQHESGSYTKYVEKWFLDFVGFWSDNAPICDLSKAALPPTEFEITQDEQFLQRFTNSQEINRLSPAMVERLKSSDNIYGQYGYARWLSRTKADKQSLKTATEIFKQAADAGIADALQALSTMYYAGDAYDAERDELVFDIAAGAALNAEAEAKGCKTSKFQRICELFFSVAHYDNQTMNQAVKQMEEAVAENSDKLDWLDQLGIFYELVGRVDDAIEAYTKCILSGYYYPIYSLAIIYLYDKDCSDLYHELMEAGIKIGVPSCMIYGFEKESEWEQLGYYDRASVSLKLKRNIPTAAELGSKIAIHLLADYYINGKMGFEQDIEKGVRTALKGIDRRSTGCCKLLYQVMNNKKFTEQLPEELKMSEKQIAMLALKCARLSCGDMLDEVLDNRHKFAKMGLSEEVDTIWMQRWREHYNISDQTTNGKEADINPTVLIIHPSGYTEFEEVDISKMSREQIAEMIGAKQLDAVRYSETMSKISQQCFLSKRLSLYYDKKGEQDEEKYNPTATMLSNRGYDIYGAVVVVLADESNNSYGFENQSDILLTYDTISDWSSIGLYCGDEDDDGRYDPWA